MTKNILIVSLFTMLAYTSYTQTIYNVQFKNGETKQVTVNYDDHNKIPRYRIGTSLFNVSFVKEAALSLYLKPEFRLNSRLILDGRANFAISQGLDENIDYRGKIPGVQYRTLKNFNVLAHYSIWSNVNTRNTAQAFDWDYSGQQVKVYIAKIPRNFYRSIEVDLGLNSVTQTSNILIEAETVRPSNGEYYYSITAPHRSISLQYGLSFYKAQAIEMKTKNNTRSYFQYYRLYFNLLSAFSNDLHFEKKSANSADSDLLPLSDDDLNPDKEVDWGYRVGGEMHFGHKNSGTSLWYGIEVGQIPYLDYGYTFTSKNLLIFHFGFAFGPKPGK